MPDKEKIAYLLMLKVLNIELTQEEEKALTEFESVEGNQQLIEELKSAGEFGLMRGLSMIDEVEKNKAEVKERLTREIFPSARVLRMSTWLKYAAVVIVAAGIATWLIMRSSKNADLKGKDSYAQFNAEGNDVSPGGTKAVLILADNRHIDLDNIPGNTDILQGNTRILNQDGQLVYQKDGSPVTGKVLYNTVITPAGGKYRLQLPDGSQVWLNAVSSIKFPVVFDGTERRVEITGEVYFEVAKNKDLQKGNAIPFVVSVNTRSGITEVRVLGTHFNVRAYADEPLVTTSVLEGKVIVRRPNSKGHADTLTEGESDSIAQDNSGDVIRQNEAATDEQVAWKNDFFSFERTDVPTLMRELARWYNLEVEYDFTPTELYTGRISRTMTLKQVLLTIEYVGIHFKIDGNKLLITR